MKIVITRRLPAPVVEPLAAEHDVFMWEREDEPIPRSVLLREAADADAVLTNVADVIDRELFEHAPRLKVVSTMAVGYNNIDLTEAARRGIAVGHTPDVLTEAVADLTFALMLAVARRVVEGVRYIKSDRWQGWGPMLLTGQSVYGATIGIIGMGRIGEAVARRAQGFGMRILYHNRSRRPAAERELGAAYCTLDELLARSDYVVMLAPAAPDTRHMLGAAQFARMKRSAIVVNASRGDNIDERALCEALASRRIWGAGLDVFEREPIDSRHPLASLDNAVLLPHIGSATVETRMRMAAMAARNITAGLAGEPLPHAVPAPAASAQDEEDAAAAAGQS